MHDILIDVSNGGHIINIAHRHLHQSTQTRLRFIKQLAEGLQSHSCRIHVFFLLQQKLGELIRLSALGGAEYLDQLPCMLRDRVGFNSLSLNLIP
jgi:hypothetical protein